MSSYSSSFFTGNGNNAPSKPDFGKPMRDLFLLEEGTGETEHHDTIKYHVVLNMHFFFKVFYASKKTIVYSLFIVYSLLTEYI